MESIIIKGGKPLIGEINISGAKNASLPIMAACLLTAEDVILTNIPKLSDINTMSRLLENHGTQIERHEAEDDSLTLKINSSNVANYLAPYEIVRKMRASIWVLGPLLARFGEAIVSFPGGCALGARQVDLHIAAMEAMGATIEIKEGYIHAKSDGRLKGAHFTFAKKSVGATINAVLAATLAEGKSVFTNCAIEPEIVDLCEFLNKMGAKISGIGNEKIIIEGVEALHGTKHAILPDRIEAGTYMIAAAATRGDVRIKGISYSLLTNLIDKMQDAGISITENADHIHVHHQGEIKPVNISTEPYPGFSTDLQAQFMSLMIVANGSSTITENIFENRFMHVPELSRMGANIAVSGNVANVTGVDKLNAAEVMASDLRASVSLVIAALCAKGTTKINRVYHLDRGYQALEQKLASCGADIERV